MENNYAIEVEDGMYELNKKEDRVDQEILMMLRGEFIVRFLIIALRLPNEE
jgi:hypothetical protein